MCRMNMCKRIMSFAIFDEQFCYCFVCGALRVRPGSTIRCRPRNVLDFVSFFFLVRFTEPVECTLKSIYNFSLCGYSVWAISVIRIVNRSNSTPIGWSLRHSFVANRPTAFDFIYKYPMCLYIFLATMTRHGQHKALRQEAAIAIECLTQRIFVDFGCIFYEKWEIEN